MGMFRAASPGFAFMRHFGMGTFEIAASSFLASIVSGAMLQIASVLKVGPNEA